VLLNVYLIQFRLAAAAVIAKCFALSPHFFRQLRVVPVRRALHHIISPENYLTYHFALRDLVSALVVPVNKHINVIKCRKHKQSETSPHAGKN